MLDLRSFCGLTSEEIFQALKSHSDGLTSEEAEKRFTPSDLLHPKKKTSLLLLFLEQYKSPIILILIFAALLSHFLHQHTDTVIILSIVFLSGMLGFWQEWSASNAVQKLLQLVEIKVSVLRDQKTVELPIDRIVPGDVIILSAGDNIPGDCLILESNSLFVDEAALTGESYPVEKCTGRFSEETPLAKRFNTLFMGTHVVSGTAKGIVVRIGINTEFGKISERLTLRAPETEFQRGIRRFGYFLMEVTLLLIITIFLFNVYLHRPVLESFLFALALAVGLTPQLLPAIITVNLSHGAKRMAEEKVIVKRLTAIENFGSMDVLCSDKTGTLTQGAVRLHAALDLHGNASQKTHLYAYLNSFYETGFKNPIDEAIRNSRSFDLQNCTKLDEVPYDFIRRKLSVLVSLNGKSLLITKGALQNVLEVCSFAQNGENSIIALNDVSDLIETQYHNLCQSGFRVLGLAYRDVESQTHISKDDEKEMIFMGFLVLFDPLRDGIAETVTQLRNLGVTLKIITGDNRIVAATVGAQVGLRNVEVLTGSELRKITEPALQKRVNEVDVFAEIEPNQKERIILALRSAGHVVGYLGDGINDASALHAADIGISVDSGVDVAKEAADFVLLEKNLAVLSDGVQEGRRTFANTLKYVFMATSANFGNMFSMAGASLFLAFLPLLPKQILLCNLLTDFPEMTIATDNVDEQSIEKPRRWDIKFIQKFMIVFGLANSACDYLTFGVLLWFLHATPEQFRTGWFIENVVTAALIVLVIRTRKPFWQSKPSLYLLLATLFITGAVLVLPYFSWLSLFEFKPLPISFIGILVLIMIFYVVVAEIAKSFFYRRSPKMLRHFRGKRSLVNSLLGRRVE